MATRFRGHQRSNRSFRSIDHNHIHCKFISNSNSLLIQGRHDSEDEVIQLDWSKGISSSTKDDMLLRAIDDE